jgi:hypothetical protein
MFLNVIVNDLEIVAMSGCKLIEHAAVPDTASPRPCVVCLFGGTECQEHGAQGSTGAAG